MTAPSTATHTWYVVHPMPGGGAHALIAANEADAHAMATDGYLCVQAVTESLAKQLAISADKAIRRGMAVVNVRTTSQNFGSDARRCTLCLHRVGYVIADGELVHRDYRVGSSGRRNADVMLCDDCYPGAN